ncbi:MAG: sigma-70 family RNA polymerase sigma factor [Acidobacteriota bacterium]|nr:sigma-70 family RNA polymerase sigma factor [Acidobacteriota bacterium]
MQNICEADLVSLARQGSDAAFNELVRRHQRTMLQTAISILRNREEAEDEVQNAWWKGWRHIAQFEGEARFSTWMTRIVMNQCLMRLRQARRARFVSIDRPDAGDTPWMELRDTAESPESGLRKREEGALLRREISRIPPLLRNALVLRDVNRMPMPDVAGELGISLAAAKSRLLRARHELRARLERSGSPPARPHTSPTGFGW